MLLERNAWCSSAVGLAMGILKNIYCYYLQIKDLKRGIKVKMSRKEVLEKTGELISLRYASQYK